MEKISQRYPMQYKKDEAGCIRGFINIFDFRNGRSTRKLLADRRQASRQFAGASSSMKLANPNPGDKSFSCQIQDDDESEAATLDFKTSVKDLMEEDMSSEPSLEDQRNDIETMNKGRHTKKNRKRTEKTYGRSRSMSLSDLDAKNVGSDDLQIMMEELGQIHIKTNSFRKKYVQHTDSKQSDRAHPVLEEKLSAAIEMFVNHKLKNSRHFEEDEITDNSKELMDALQTLSCNKELCWRLLQDPNSRLVKHIESLEDRVEKGREPNLIPKNGLHAEKDEIINAKQGYFFRRRSKSHESYPLMEDERSARSSKIVILKPGPAGLHFPGSPIGNKLQNGKNSSHFSFTKIKRRLKKVVGKERQGISHEEITYKKHRDNGESIGWSSPNRNHFYTERFSMPPIRGDKKGKTKDIEETRTNESSNHPKLEISNIYLEAKKHLLEMLDNREKEEELISEKLQSLGRILSLPDYSTSPNCSPRKCTDEQQILSPRTRVAPSDSYQTEEHTVHLSNSRSPSSAAEINSKQHIELANANLDVPCELNCDSVLEKAVSSAKDDMDVAGILDREEQAPTGYQEDGKVSDASCEPCSFSITIDSGSADVTEAISTETSSQSLEFASECLSDSCVAEEIFSDRSAPPLQSDELEIQPQKVHFEEPDATSLHQQLYTLTFLENEESAFEYVEAVLLGSGLNWDEFLLSWLSSDQILDPSLFDEVELLSDWACRKLLFDCTNEILTEVCDRYFGCFPGTSYAKQNPTGMDLIHEVWEGVEWYLLNTPLPHSLDQLVRKDIERPAAWMDVKSDLENIGVRIEAAVLEELVEETLLSFANDTLGGNLISPEESEIEVSID